MVDDEKQKQPHGFLYLWTHQRLTSGSILDSVAKRLDLHVVHSASARSSSVTDRIHALTAQLPSVILTHV